MGGPGRPKKLSRSQRAECRAHARKGATMASLSIMYDLSVGTIAKIVNNKSKSGDNLDSDEDHVNPSTTPGLLGMMGNTHASSSKLVHVNNIKKDSATSPADTVAKKVASSSQKELSQTNSKKSLASADKDARKKTSASTTLPTPLSAVAVEKRKFDFDETEGAPESSTPSKAMKVESSISVRQPKRIHPNPTAISRAPRRLCQRKSIAVDVYRLPPAFGSSTMFRDPLVGLSDRGTTSTSSKTVTKALSINPSPIRSYGPLIKTPAAPSGNAAVLIFLNSHGRDLSRLLPTFIELGIKDADGITLLKTMPREEHEEWFDKLAEQGKITSLEARALLCTLHG